MNTGCADFRCIYLIQLSVLGLGMFWGTKRELWIDFSLTLFGGYANQGAHAVVLGSEVLAH
jgi:hypothetical protein